MSIGGIEAVGGFTPYAAPRVSGPTEALGTTSTAGPHEAFGSMVLDGLDRLEKTQDRADGLAVQAATGDLTSIHDYTIAAAEANVTTQLTVAVRNKAVEAFNDIMRMQV